MALFLGRVNLNARLSADRPPVGARESERSVDRYGWGEHMARSLTAILALDTVGYSRLMAADEEGTHARLKAHREELLDPTIAKYQGHVIKNTGDGLLAEFPSAVDCVACAVEIQRRMARRNQDVVPDRRLELRIGINVGDVMKDGGYLRHGSERRGSAGRPRGPRRHPDLRGRLSPNSRQAGD